MRNFSYLVDFGSVQDVYRNTITRGSTFVGTIDYMSPEHIRGKASFASDLYSLGCTLLYLLTRSSPSELPVKRMKINFRHSLNLSQPFADWLDIILNPVVEDRFSSTKEALLALEHNRVKDYSFIPVNNSTLKFKHDKNKLLIIIPSVGIQNTKIVELASCLLLGYVVDFVFRKNGDKQVADFFLPLFTIVFIFCILMILLELLYSAFCEVHLEISPSAFIIERKWKITISKIRKETRSIQQIKLQRENDPLHLEKTLSQCIIRANNREYKIGKYLTEAENKWLVTELRNSIDSFLPKQKSFSQKSQSEWSHNLFDI